MCGLVAAGLLYVVLSLCIKTFGSGFLHKLLPPVVVGPVIMVIGLVLAPVAVHMAMGRAGDGSISLPRIGSQTIVTNMMLERMASYTGPTEGKILCPADKAKELLGMAEDVAEEAGDQVAEAAFACGVDFLRTCAQLAAFVDTDDDAVDRAARGITRSRKIFHKSFVALLFFRAVTDKTIG